jgi:hypothetical protein
MIVELRMVLPHPGIPYSHKNELSKLFHFENDFPLVNHSPVFG